MKAALLVEDRDLAYLFLDTDNAPSDSRPVIVEIDGVDWADVEDEDKAIWFDVPYFPALSKLRIRPRAGFDFKNADFNVTGCPIPTPVIVFDKAEYDRHDY